MLRLLLSTMVCLCLNLGVIGQPCSGQINSFPYIENFEANNGGWIAGGASSSWAWGTPAKPTITGAGEGTKCWITGGLTGIGYNNAENSWLMSPCFDLSNLQNPDLSFMIFWETERRFDGASFQYSTDGGNTWTLLGDMAGNCMSYNWFNEVAITYLSGMHGWSGNNASTIGNCLSGNGSNNWRTARHTLSHLAGQPNVRFRFLFGAGTTCNNFDGFAIDDLRIEEKAPNPVSISSICLDSNSVMFMPNSVCHAEPVWNFGDPTSGSDNTSMFSNPTHHFSGPGLYTVSLTVLAGAATPVTVTKDVIILGTTGNTNWPGACNNTPDATLSVNVTGGNGNYFYNWNTAPAQTTPSITNMGAGTYTVTVSAVDACAVSHVFDLTTGGSPINFSAFYYPEFCDNNNGKIDMILTGGTAPLTYSWSNGATTEDISNLNSGMYSLQVTDANGCVSTSRELQIYNVDSVLNPMLGPDLDICPGVTYTLHGGNFKTYLWQDGSTASTFSFSQAGTYHVTVTDTLGCSGSDTIKVTMDCKGIYFPNSFTPNYDGKNDLFGPLGNLTGLNRYRLSIFDRYGNRVFYSTNPFQKWNGTFRSAGPNSGAFVWTSEFELNGTYERRKGSILLIR